MSFNCICSNNRKHKIHSFQIHITKVDCHKRLKVIHHIITALKFDFFLCHKTHLFSSGSHLVSLIHHNSFLASIIHTICEHNSKLGEEAEKLFKAEESKNSKIYS
ncbi:hypothetical protein ES288_D07G173600v1 [Gossypium darwinii]|uniref:Uncharacterized protein n=1 Tax=Gossypium darwinii TaxID=34276 RepID=A0A5D2C047_GOSDA|nr:hypothetical protein ES288_D07G173600v1 [Gossypium darwinii]